MKIIFIFLLINTALFANIIHVPTDSTSIQAGINGANDGDTVLVAEGIYYESILIYDKNILLTSDILLYPENDEIIQNTIIDGDSSFRLYSIQYSDATMAGFTFQNGYTSTWGGAGGGPYSGRCRGSDYP